jgi:type II secretory pathway pseudopilin PulG
MQRKNSVLSKKSYRSGMAIVMAIAVIVVVATIMALSLSMTTQTSKKTTDLYLYEQASILSHSAAEYAMLKLSKANPCSIKSINFKYNSIYDVNTTMQYISVAGSACDSNAIAIGRRYALTTHLKSDGTVIMEIAVSVNDTNVASEPIRYFRRTIQKL